MNQQYYGIIDFYGKQIYLEDKPKNYQDFLNTLDYLYPPGFLKHCTIEYKSVKSICIIICKL